MKRTIRITESQLNEIVKKINEGGELDVNYKKPGNGVATVSDMTTQMKDAQNAAAPGTKVNLNVSQEDLNLSEKKGITKRQIKEARLNKLVRESIGVIKKKNLK